MTLEAIKHINQILNDMNLNFEFGSNNVVTFPYWTTFYQEFEPYTEDGFEQGTFVLTGTTNKSFLDLEKTKEAIKKRFTTLGDTCILPNGNGLMIAYQNSLPVPTNDGALKRIQINLQIKEWTVQI